MAEQCQHHLRTLPGGEIWPCTRVTAHVDGWHEHVVSDPALVSVTDVDYDRVRRPAVAAVVIRWRERLDDDDDGT